MTKIILNYTGKCEENTNPVSSTETENYYIWAKVQLKKQKKKHI